VIGVGELAARHAAVAPFRGGPSVAIAALPALIASLLAGKSRIAMDGRVSGEAIEIGGTASPGFR
jgi:hypothetical protein